MKNSITKRTFAALQASRGLAWLVGLAISALAIPAASNLRAQGSGQFCTATATAIAKACDSQTQDDYWIAVANCINEGDASDRAECLADAAASKTEATRLCRDQLTGRLDACALLGEERYDPEFEPADFDKDFANLPNPNRYFPLAVGNRWEYRGGTEVNTVEVLDQTKLIDEVTCVVVRDLVYDSGMLKEATDDWYAQAKNGDAWYCGEEVKDFEHFRGDRPRRPELVSIDGSFKAGRDGAKPGVIFRAFPRRGESYLEEFSLGNAEDVTTVLSTNYGFGTSPDLDRNVPQRLARIFCAGNNCVVTKNFSLLEPGLSARKYYAPGIGVFLEVESTGDTSQLVACNFDARCTGLPRP
jgi:hypothetical protein